jgi:hypothetical protein
MVVALENFSYRLGEPRATKPAIKSVLQLRGMPADLLYYVGSCRLCGDSMRRDSLSDMVELEMGVC